MGKTIIELFVGVVRLMARTGKVAARLMKLYHSTYLT